jgi:hypothetical protein
MCLESSRPRQCDELIRSGTEEVTMNNEPGKKPEDESRDSSPPELTEADVRDALRQSADGANELNKKLKEVFALTDASATLRLR